MSTGPGRIVRFGAFKANLQTLELHKSGLRIRIQDKPMMLLAALIERPGEVVAREELQQRLWPDVEYLDFEHGLNMAVKKLRAALNDSPDSPRYIETLARKGYRFIAPLESAEHEAVSVSPPDAGFPTRRWKIPAILASAGVLILLATVPFILPQPPQIKISPLLSSSFTVPGIRFSPDGRELVYTAAAESGGHRKLWVKALGIAPARRLTDDADAPHNESLPRWVPDGSGISFLRSGDILGASLFIVPVGGGTPRKLMDLGRCQGYWWAPDAKSVVASLVEPDGAPSLYRVIVASGQRQRLTAPAQQLSNANTQLVGDTAPQFSPDGKWIAFVRRLASGPVLMVMPAAGGEAKELTHLGFSLFDFDWTPTSRELIVSGKGEAPFPSLYRVSLSGGRRSPLSIGNAGEIGPVAVSLTGSRMAYGVKTPQSTIWRYQLRQGQPPVPQRVVAQSPHTQTSPDFAPDGSRFAFASDRSGNMEIYTADRDGRNPIQLTSFGTGMAGWPRWSPDGKRIAFDARPSGHAQVFVVDAEGGTPRALTPAAGDSVMPAWSPDGAWIYYTLFDGKGGSDIWKVASAGRTGTRVTTMNVAASLPAADGAHVFVEKVSASALFSVPLSGAPAVRVAGLPVSFPGATTVAQTGIYFFMRSPDGHFRQLMYYSFAKQLAEPLLSLQGVAWPPAISVSRDETEMLLAQSEGVMSEVMLVENFR